jgi:WhiB family redox-sensing transcriptional regulator
MPTPLNPRPLAVPQGDWWKHGACRDVDKDLFFSAPHEDPVAHHVRVGLAKAVCEACSVRGECLEWAVKHERYGVWGGKDFDARVKRVECDDCAYQVCWNTPCLQAKVGQVVEAATLVTPGLPPDHPVRGDRDGAA